MARAKKGKAQKRKTFIFVEGPTEKIYFEWLRQKIRSGNIKIVTTVLGCSGNNWIEKAQNKMQKDSNFKRDKDTDVFVIFDKDNHTEEEYEKMKRIAQKDNIKIGFSNSMFEVWLLSHYEIVSSGVFSKAILTNKLSKHLDDEYKKAHSSQIEKIVELYEDAIKNSQNIVKPDFHKQSTNIGKIIVIIKNQG